MKKDLTLVILAAGMGSRFGGLKQIEPIGPNGEFIIDYSIYDAVRAGFTKVVFVIKEENYDIFRDTIGKRIENVIDVSYVFQKLDDLPEGYELPVGREKPWGTAQAVLACRNSVKGNFVMINSDDFYGKTSYMKVKEFFDKLEDDNTYAMVGFKVMNTMTENGSVKRGVCEEENGYLTNIIESSIERVDDKIIASPLSWDKAFEVSGNDLVSMNFFGFTEKIFTTIANGFPKFLEDTKDNPLKSEYLIPDIVFEEIRNDKKVAVLESGERWLGVTYKEDKEYVVSEIRKLIELGEYPNNLWK